MTNPEYPIVISSPEEAREISQSFNPEEDARQLAHFRTDAKALSESFQKLREENSGKWVTYWENKPYFSDTIDGLIEVLQGNGIDSRRAPFKNLLPNQTLIL